MNSVSEIDFIIVGQGLAGSAISMRALAGNYKILVLDEPSQNRSSTVAAGMFNPVTGRKPVKTWLADDLFPFLHRYYSNAERLTKSKFFYPMPLYRPFGTIEAQNEWMGKSADDHYSAYIASISLSGSFGDKVKDPYGGVTFRQTGYLDTRAYLNAIRQYLADRAAYQATTFDFNKLEPGHDFVRYNHVRAKKVIFCQGVANAANPWFGHIPIRPLKGEFLTVQCALEKNVILNRGVYLVPDARPGEWRAGATYHRDDHSPETTSAARNELALKLEDLISMPYTITGQQWGVRPTTPDRKPIVGAHPRHKSMIIFNGFGTKGVSLAPYFSDVLIRWIENKGAINKEADVTRFN